MDGDEVAAAMDAILARPQEQWRASEGDLERHRQLYRREPEISAEDLVHREGSGPDDDDWINYGNAQVSLRDLWSPIETEEKEDHLGPGAAEQPPDDGWTEEYLESGVVTGRMHMSGLASTSLPGLVSIDGFLGEQAEDDWPLQDWTPSFGANKTNTSPPAENPIAQRVPEEDPKPAPAPASESDRVPRRQRQPVDMGITDDRAIEEILGENWYMEEEENEGDAHGSGLADDDDNTFGFVRVPARLRCPLSGAVLVDAVYGKDGRVYDRRALEVAQGFTIARPAPEVCEEAKRALEDTVQARMTRIQESQPTSGAL